MPEFSNVQGESKAVRPAPLPLRALAKVFDLGVYLGLMELAGALSHQLPFRGLVPLDEGVLVAIDLTVGVSALVVYLMLSERMGGATLGKWVTRIRVVAEPGGGPLDLQKAFRRNVFLFVDVLTLGLGTYSSMARSEKRQSIGDWFGGTMVVRSRDAEGAFGMGWVVGIPATLALVLMSYVAA